MKSSDVAVLVPADSAIVDAAAIQASYESSVRSELPYQTGTMT